MKKFLFAATLLFVLSPALSFAQEAAPAPAPAAVEAPTPVAPPADKSTFHLYLLIGQSNMEGRGAIDAESKIADPRVLSFDKNNQWVPATDPLHFGDKGIMGTGPGLAFGKAMAAKNPNVTIGLIPCAVGGTPLSRWVKGAPLYKNAVARTQEAMKTGELKGILWHQGESDSKNEENATTYGTRLAGMITDLRAELGKPELPVVVGELGEFLSDTSLPFWKTVNEAIKATPAAVPHCGLAKSEGLTSRGDHLHFNAEGARGLGRRYAEEMERLQKIP